MASVPARTALLEGAMGAAPILHLIPTTAVDVA
jgi:hypothetical protein